MHGVQYSSNGYHYSYKTQYLGLIAEVLNEAVWMVVLLLVERNKEGEVVPVPILLVSHVICNPEYKALCKKVTSMQAWLFHRCDVYSQPTSLISCLHSLASCLVHKVLSLHIQSMTHTALTIVSGSNILLV